MNFYYANPHFFPVFVILYALSIQILSAKATLFEEMEPQICYTKDVKKHKWWTRNEEHSYPVDDVRQKYYLIQPPKNPEPPVNVKNNFLKFKFNEPWYILPVYYSFSPTYDEAELMRLEFKSQVSFKLELLDDVLCRFCALAFNYTQVIYLQVYNDAQSSPLRDIDLSPGFSFDYKRPIPINEGRGGYINWLSVGYIHISNGEKEDINANDPRQNTALWQGSFVRSKSLDRFFFSIGYSYKDLSILLRTWVKSRMIAFDGDRTNGDIFDYMGYGDIKISYKYKNNLFELYINNIINNYFTKQYWNWKGKVELGYSYGINKNYAIYVQYLFGHGDSLYEYSLPVSRIGIGVRLRDF